MSTANLLSYRDYKMDDDWSPALSRAMEEHETVYIPAGVYNMSALTVPSGKTIYGDGDSTQLRPLDERLFLLCGSVEGTANLAVDMEDFSNNLQIDHPIELQAGDLIYLFGQRNCQILQDCGPDWTLGRTYAKGFSCFFAEFLRAETVSDDGMHITCEKGTIFPYYYADGTREHAPKAPHVYRDDYPFMRSCTTVQRIKPAEHIVLRSMMIVGGHAGTVIRGQWMAHCLLEKIHFRTDESHAPEPGFIFLHISESTNCCVKECDFDIPAPPPARTDYVWADYWSYNTARILSSFHSGFEGCTSNFSSHAFEIGKADHRGAGSDCYVRGCKASNMIWSGVFVAGGCYDVRIQNNEFSNAGQGIVTCGRKNTITGNVIDLKKDPRTNYYYVRPADGGTLGIALIEGYAIDSVVADNQVMNAVTAYIIRDGYEDDNRFESGAILLRDNKASNCINGLMVYRNTANTGEKNFQLTLEGNHFTGGAKGSAFAGENALLIDSEMNNVVLKDNCFSGFAHELTKLPQERRCARPLGKRRRNVR